MRRFELSEGNSNKFWEIDLQGSAFTVRFGRIGTSGQSKEKSFDSESKAKAEFDKLVAEKLKKGYLESVGESAARALASAVATSSQGADTPRAPDAAPPQRAPAPREEVSRGVPEEDQRLVAWDDSFLRRVHPRRGGVPVPVRPVLAPQAAWTAVRTEWARIADRVHQGRRDAGDLGSVLDALGERLATDVPSVGTAEQDTVLLALLRTRANWDDSPKVRPFVDLLLALGGPRHATEVVIGALDLHVLRDKRTAQPLQGFVLQRGQDPHWFGRFAHENIDAPARLRELLATHVDSAAYAEAVRTADALSSLNDDQRMARAYVFPTESHWAEAEVDTERNEWLLTAVSSRPVLQKFVATLVPFHLYGKVHSIVASAVDGLGPDALDLLSELFRIDPTSGVGGSIEVRRAAADALSRLNSDDAQRLLFSSLDKDTIPFAVEAALRWPRRAVQLLAPVAASRARESDPARTVLRQVARRLPAVVQAELVHLPEEARRAAAALLPPSGPDVPDASADQLPSILVAPPWLSTRKATKRPSLDAVVPPSVPDATAWLPGEREEFSRTSSWSREYQSSFSTWTEADWMRYRAEPKAHPANEWFFLHAPEDLLADRLADFSLERWFNGPLFKRMLARLELTALPLLDALLDERGAAFLEFIQPFAAARLAPKVASFLAAKRARPLAKRWLTRHPRQAAAGLLAGALGAATKQSSTALDALRLLVNEGHGDTVFDIARTATPPVDGVLSERLDEDPLLRVPARIPKLPAFASVDALPIPLLANGATKLPPAAVENLLTMLAFSDPEAPYAGLELVKAACEPKSLAQFAWSLFEAWLIVGAPSKEAWALRSVGVFGDDECARRLAALIRQWPGEAAHARAVAGIDVLAAIGTDVTLTYLNGIAEKVKFKGLQEKAREKISQIAEARGLTRDELADRLVPDLGLEADGSIDLDFGERRFKVGFDEQLKPYVRDAEGVQLKELPKPTKKDDPEKSTAAEERWKALKKDARQVARLQVLRMELAMCGRRRWSAPVFRELFVEHPLLVHIVRRLVWATYATDGRVVHTFRVAEDRTFADAQDDGWTLDEDAEVGIPHALELDGSTAAAWGQLFADYELLQPFPQLGRPTWTATKEELESTRLTRVQGEKVPTGKVLGLEARGWRRGTPLDGGVVTCMEKPHALDRVIELELDPGIFTGMVSEAPEQTLGIVSIRRPDAWTNEDQFPLAELDPVLFSELIRDLEGLRS